MEAMGIIFSNIYDNNMGELTAVLDLLRQTAGVDDELLGLARKMIDESS